MMCACSYPFTLEPSIGVVEAAGECKLICQDAPKLSARHDQGQLLQHAAVCDVLRPGGGNGREAAALTYLAHEVGDHTVESAGLVACMQADKE